MSDKNAPTADLIDLAPSVSVLSEGGRFHALSHDGARVLIAQNLELELRDVVTGEVFASVHFPKGLFDAKLSPDGTRLAVWAYEYRVLVYELPGCRKLGEVEGLKTQFGEVHWTRDSSRLGIVSPWFNGHEPIVVLDRDGRRLDDVPRPFEGRHVSPAGPSSLVCAESSPGAVFSADLRTGEVSPLLALPSGVDTVAGSATRFAAGCRPLVVALGSLPGASAALPAQASLDRGTADRLRPLLTTLEARRDKARSRHDQQTLDGALASVRDVLQKGVPHAPGMVTWASGAGTGLGSHNALTGVAFVDEDTLLASGPHELVRASLREPFVEDVLVRVPPKLGAKVTLSLLAVAGRTAALRVSSPMGAFYQRDVLLRFELEGAGLGGPDANVPAKKPAAKSTRAKR
jgi:hypothetical protein